MPSKARKAFDSNISDINRLIDMYEAAHELIEVQGEEKMPAGYDVALRSALVLLVTCWEAYIEDIVSEGIEHYSTTLKDPQDLPDSLRRSILKHLARKGQDSYWDLSGDGWKNILANLLKELKAKRDFSFMSPESQKTKEFVAESLGLEDITSSWDFEGRSAEENAALLDKYVKVRGKIAHRAKLAKKVEVDTVHAAVSFFKLLVSKSGGKINKLMKDTTGTGLWN